MSQNTEQPEMLNGKKVIRVKAGEMIGAIADDEVVIFEVESAVAPPKSHGFRGP